MVAVEAPLLVECSKGLQALQQLLLEPRFATVVVVPLLLLGYFLAWIEVGTYRETEGSRGLGAATGVVRVVGAISAAACRLLPLLLQLPLVAPDAALDPAVTWLVTALVPAPVADCDDDVDEDDDDDGSK